MVLNGPEGNPLLSPAAGPGGPAGGAGGALEDDEVEVVGEGEEDTAAADTGVVVVVVVVEAFGGDGGASGLVGWATLDETLLLELEGSVPDEAAAEAPVEQQLVSDIC